MVTVRQSETEFQLALEAARLGFWNWDLVTDEVGWSPELERLYLMEPGAFPGTFEAFVRTIHPEDRDDVVAAVGKAVGSRSDYDVRYRALRNDGVVMWIRGAAKFVFDESGTPVRLVGVAVDETERTENELRLLAAYADLDRMARTMQASLLPPVLPSPPGLELAARYRVGGDGVSGDFYDAFRVDRRRWAILIGDVCGHGVEAATLTAELRHAFRTAALLAGRPNDVMSAVNQVHRAGPHANRFSSAHYLTCRPGQSGAMQIQLATAGHPHLWHLSGDRATPRRADGALLGIFDQPAFNVRRFPLAVGDRLVLLTDGVTESRLSGSSDLFGEDRVRHALAAGRGDPLQDMVDGLVDRAVEHSGSEVRDDIAVLAIERTSLPSDELHR